VFLKEEEFVMIAKIVVNVKVLVAVGVDMVVNIQ